MPNGHQQHPSRAARIAIALMLAACRGWGADDPASDALAATILQKAAMEVGLIEMPRIGDGALAAAFARSGVAQVHGLAGNPAAVELAQRSASQSAVLGSQVIVETGVPAALPLADWVADLMVVADATDANLAELPPAEVRRALSPYRGAAVVGAPAGHAGLTLGALRAWAEKTGGTATLSDDATGAWAVVRMPPLPGGDDWSHHLHGPDGDLVSNDTAFGAPPFGLQWTGLPYHDGHWDIHVIAAGRMFSAQSSVFQRPGGIPFELVARNAYSGQVLWRRPIDQSFGESGSFLVARADLLYLKDKNRVLLLDAETGAERGAITAAQDPGQQCMWLLESDGVLVTLTGPVQQYGGDAQDYAQSPHKLKAQDETSDLYEGHELIGWSVPEGRQLWSVRDTQIDPNLVTIRDGHVYFYADRAYAACLDLRTGSQLWKTTAPISEPKGPGMGYVAGHATVKALSMYRDGAIATKDAYVIDDMPHRQSQAFSTADGHVLWERMKGPQGADPKAGTELADTDLLTTPVVIGTCILERENWRRKSGVFDLLTGGMVDGGIRFNYGGCGRFTGVASGLLIGQNGEISDIKTKKRILEWNAKSTCGAGQFVADGLLFKVGSACPGCSEWRGFFALRSVPSETPPSGPRLEAGATPSPATAASDASDWRTYRSDDTRKCSSSATIGATAAVRWVYAPPSKPFSLGDGAQYLAADAVSTAAIAVGDRAWIGTADGAVVCLDRTSGAVVWQHWTAGRIWSSPSWADGRIYAGSSDGWLYCLDAATGALAWRYRVAPQERRIMFLGRLASAWPILANVVVEDGVAYAAGGLVGQAGGAELCALDAKTGTARWTRHYAVSASGQLAWYSGKLWWHSGDAGVYVVDAASGEIHHAAPGARIDWFRSRGQDIGILPGGWVAFGGRQFNLPAAAMEQDRNDCSFLRAGPDGPAKDATGALDVALMQLDRAQEFDSIPAWDERGVLFFGKPSQYQSPAQPAAFCPDAGAWLSAQADEHAKAKAVKGGLGYQCAWTSHLVPPEEQHVPTLKGLYQRGSWSRPTIALARNAYVVFLDTAVYALDRSDGRQMWVVKLPGPAEANGIALTRAGDVIVSLRDGRVACVGAPDAPATASPAPAPR